jgi:hypothetical protein
MKGKGKSTEVGGVEYKVLSIGKLLEDQQTAIDYVKDMLGLKVSQRQVGRGGGELVLPR